MGICVSPDGSKVYIACSDEIGKIVVLNSATNAVTASISVSHYLTGMAITPDGSRLYVTNRNTYTVSVIDAIADTVIYQNITVGHGPYGLCVSPDGSKVYVADCGSNSVSVINTATNLVSDSIPVGQCPMGISITPDGSKVLVANYYSSTVSVINTATNTVSATILVGAYPVAFGNFISTYTQPNSIAIHNIEETISISPNPATDKLNITIKDNTFQSATITITNIIGETVMQTTINDKQSTIDISTLSKGMYFVESNVDGKRSVVKVVKE